MFSRGPLRKGSNGFGVPTGPRTKQTHSSASSNARKQESREDTESLDMGLKDASFHSATNGFSQHFGRKSSQQAGGSGLSASGDTGSMDSPSLGSDSIIINHTSNSVEGRTQNGENLGDDLESPDFAGGRKKKRGPRPGGPEKGGRGLRHFSMKVCEKVESKGRTTYNEVADELVAEFSNGDSLLATPDKQQYDEKNIRRRVYDALNVLMAMDIISKEKKEIQWKGLPSTDIDDVESLKAEHMQVKGRIETKAAYLKDLEEQIVGIQNLIQRNESLFQGTGTVPANGVALPFILVQTRPHATVEVEISEDMQLVHFDFNSTPFELHDDAYVLKAMRLHNIPNNGHEGANNVLKPEITEDDKMNTVNSSGMSPLKNSSSRYCHNLPTKPLNSHPLPAILKARVKQEYIS